MLACAPCSGGKAPAACLVEVKRGAEKQRQTKAAEAFMVSQSEATEQADERWRLAGRGTKRFSTSSNLD